ncbi:MAG: hypothetical protein JST51_08915 [Armatimonadetes bacterium]|nr:hypothetical protein [Armatimonadota bacterium]
MAYKLTPLGKAVVFIGKWIALPLLFVLIGYSIIGPAFGGSKPAASNTAANSATPSTNTPDKNNS